MTDFTAIPAELTAGDLWTWTRSLADYPASTWTLTAYFANKDHNFNVVAVASGDDHVATIAAATSADIEPGTYTWFERVVNGATIETIERGQVIVLPNLELGGDPRTYWERVRDDLADVIANRAKTGDTLSYNIAGRGRSFQSWADIYDAHDHAVRKVAEEQGKRPGRVLVRFGDL